MRVSNFHLGIGIPCSFPSVPASFFYSFVYLEKPDFSFIHADNGPIDTLRNDIVEKALTLGVTNLIMMDTDQVYPPDTITKLLAHRLPVVGAKVNRRYPPFDPVIMKITDEGYQPLDDYDPGSLVECDATGTGCIMFDMEVFRKLPSPWFRFQKNPENGLTIGEDVGLCQDLKEAGYKIFVDTSIEVGHLTTMIANDSLHRLYRAMEKQKGEKAASAVLNIEKQF
jgi:hypothetical protein